MGINILVTIKTFDTRISAEIAKSKLAASGIESIILADDGGGTRPFPMSYKFGVELKIDQKDKAKAEKLL